MRMGNSYWFSAGMLAGVAVLAGGVIMKEELKNLKHVRCKAAAVTAMLADEAGHKISYMGKRLARRMR